jgi:hypothetical protein
MLSLLFFFIDFFFAALCDSWVICSLVAYFSYLLVWAPEKKWHILIAIIFLLGQDCFWYGRVGLGLIYIVPAIILCFILRVLFHRHFLVLLYILLVISFFLFDLFFVKVWFFDRNSFVNLVESTIFKIFGTLTIGTLVQRFLIFLFGTRGDRFL